MTWLVLGVAFAFALGLAAVTETGERVRYAIGRYVCLLRTGHVFGYWKPLTPLLIEFRACRYCTRIEERPVYPTGPLVYDEAGCRVRPGEENEWHAR